jgi:hypothetical protein
MDAGTETTERPAKRPPFKVRASASVNHLNVRKEGPEDERILACDVKIELKDLPGSICRYFDESLEDFLWRGDTDAKIVRNAFLSPVVYVHTISSAVVEIGSNRFFGCEVKKFAIEPKDGFVVNLACSVSLYPGSDEVSDLAKLVQDEAQVSIEGPPDLFADETPAAAPAPAPANGTLPLDPTRDELYAQAEALVRKEHRASISMVQRHLQIGYNRAAQLLEQLQDGGVVSPMDATGKRHVHKTTTTGEQQ